MTDQPETIKQSFDKLVKIANQFEPNAKVTNIQHHGSGNINSTFLVTLELQPPFILQCLNTVVFCQPELVMNNICTLSDYVHQKLERNNFSSQRRWLIPRVLFTAQKQNHYVAEDGSFWRGISFIDNSQSFDTIQDLQHAQEIGYGLGMFHRLLTNLPTEQLADTLAGFHITPGYLKHYHQVREKVQIESSVEVNYCLQFIRDRPNLPYILENAKANGKLHLRTIHGDPKINNIMIDCSTKEAVAMIDLDTVKPGLIHYDIGDCLRSGCNLLGEETSNWTQVKFEPQLAQAILKGYLEVAWDFLTQDDYQYIYDSIRLLAFELGLRFFTDYLEGNVYFNANHDEHNLARALVQFKLTESIESQQETIEQIIAELMNC
ncbi:MAG: aminoglycoside phosphotransferase family protein [Pleurocapsa sp. SU_5_0]|nr:aminoglycoside phosphotransferase family protein [Pleurocapsa sp. SU_5_0]